MVAQVPGKHANFTFWESPVDDGIMYYSENRAESKRCAVGETTEDSNQMIAHSDIDTERLLTDEEQARALAAMDRLERLSREILARRQTERVSPESWKLLNEIRDERDRELA